MSFNTKTAATVASQTVEAGAQVAEPAAPTREGFRFGGWFTTKRGLTWLEPEAVKFPLVANKRLLYTHIGN